VYWEKPGVGPKRSKLRTTGQNLAGWLS
jgi:hypothetical protein